jgi:DNA-binding LacI/PurR family transcriptional regulator
MIGRKPTGRKPTGREPSRRPSAERAGAVTILDVARRAGVSHSTVSRVLGGAVRPRAATADAVERAVRDLGYRANPVARSMRTGSTAAIGLIVDNLLDPVFPTILRAVEESAAAAGYWIVLGTAIRGPAQAAAEIEAMIGRRVDGLIIACSWPAEPLLPAVATLPLPVVVTNTDGPGVGIPQIGSDNEGGARLAAEHLLGLGHRSVAWVGGSPAAPFDEARVRGLRASWAEAGLDPALIRVVPGDGSVASGRHAAASVVGDPGHISAIVCYNDLTAIGVLSGLRAAGVRVPDDMSVLGFDDIAESAWTDPPLTTVTQQTAAMGRLAVDRLLAMLCEADEDLPAADVPRMPEPPVRLPATLHVRESTGPARVALN